MGCSPSHAVIISPARSVQEAICLQPRIYMVSETTLRLLQDVGELKFYHVDEKDPASDAKKFSGVADQLANPQLDDLSRKTGPWEMTGETSARVEVHGYVSESSEENVDQLAFAASQEHKRLGEAMEIEQTPLAANEAEKEEKPPQHPQIIISIDKASLACSNLATEEEQACGDVESSCYGCDSDSGKLLDSVDACEKQAVVAAASHFEESGQDVHKTDSDIDVGATGVLGQVTDKDSQGLMSISSAPSRAIFGDLPEEAEMAGMDRNGDQTQEKVEIIELDASA